MGKIAFVFSGQGAQYSGMGKELCEASPAAKAVYDMADSIREGTSKQCFEGTMEELTQTVNTQPCVFTADLAAARALQEKGITPDCVAGFSLGEIAALAFAGALSDEEAFKLVCKRGELMDKAAKENPGAMVAVLKITPEQVEEYAKCQNDIFHFTRSDGRGNHNRERRGVLRGGQGGRRQSQAASRKRSVPLSVYGSGGKGTRRIYGGR